MAAVGRGAGVVRGLGVCGIGLGMVWVGMVAMQRGDIIYVPQSGIGSAVEAVDMYFTRLIPINKGIGVGFNYDLNGTDVSNSGNTTNNIGPVTIPAGP